MILSVSPIFSNQLDQNTFIKVVLQLEIENQKAENPTVFAKLFQPEHHKQFSFLKIALTKDKTAKNRLTDEKCIQPFHPTVPTPPPNHVLILS